MSTLYLCGAGNSEGVRLALAINDVHGRWDRIVLLDDDPAKYGHSLLDVKVKGPFAELARASAGSETANLVARTTAGRRAASESIRSYGLPCATMVHPEIDLRGVELGEDLIVYHHTTLGPESCVGDGSVVFMGAIVGHECRMGRGCVLAANAVLNARVQLGEGVYVGTNATVLPEVSVGDGATIGAGSVVIEDVPAGATVMGVPARVLTPLRDPGDVQPVEPVVEHEPSGAGLAALEEGIHRVWQEVLKRECVPPDANFFDVGGDSLTALQLYERLREVGSAPHSPTDLFRFPTVRALARHLAERSGERGARRPGRARGALRRQILRGRQIAN